MAASAGRRQALELYACAVDVRFLDGKWSRLKDGAPSPKAVTVRSALSLRFTVVRS